jgi:UDP-GlcNAc:undecaprenyl-phosphate GlcNAc-1-phosphate transferase
MDVNDAVLAFLTAFAVAAALTPVTKRIAIRVGAVDEPRERGLSSGRTPLLGGLAIFAGTAVAALAFLPATSRFHGIVLGCAVITAVGAVDDRWELPAAVKLLGQILAAVIVVRAGVVVQNVTIPFVGAVDFGSAGEPLTVLGLVAIMNVVNFSDGIDGLAAGVCAIVAVAFAVIAFDLGRESAGVLAALTAGAALGFLIYNFHPASVFMGDCGSNLLGLLMGCVTVEAAVKTQVVVSLVIPLALLAVPFLDTTFVVLKRLKYHRPVYAADSEHFHHRLARIGYSQRRTVVFLYAWTLLLAGFALALRFVPYSDHHGHLRTWGTVAILAIALVVAVVSVYLVYVLEILKFRRLDSLRLRHQRPQASEAEIAADVERRLETGEFETVAGR